MKTFRRQFLGLLAGGVALPSIARTARADNYPSRPVHIVVGYAPGGVTDIAARLIAPWLSERLGQQFVIDNRPGASGNIGAEQVVRAPADGYTLLLIAANNACNATLFEKLDFNFGRDIVPIASIGQDSFVVVVNPDFPPKTLKEFIEYAKANRGTLNMGSSGAGSGSQLYGELFKSMTGIELTAVNYRGVGAALPDLLGGRLQVMFMPMASAIGSIKAGTLRALAVTSATRAKALPDVPAIGEIVPGYDATNWTGLGAPANTPPEIIALLNKQVNAGLADPAFQTRLGALGIEPFVTSPAELKTYIADYTEKWGKVIRAAGIKAE